MTRLTGIRSTGQPTPQLHVAACTTFSYNPRAAAVCQTSFDGEIATHRFRIGMGEDSHRVQPGGPLRLGGLDIPHHESLAGHSDADVLLHAITDALLGALALDDIGQMFPNSAPENRGRDSADMLSICHAIVTAAGYQIENLDCVVLAERPNLAPFKSAIRKRLAGLLDLDTDQVGLKAKTGEGVGPVGRGEAVEARCVVLLRKTT